MFTGLCAFPLTPMDEFGTDDRAYSGLIERLINAKVDSICVLGSTGNYAYLPREERARLVKLAVEVAGTLPVMTSVGALRTREILLAADDAQQAGAQALLLAPVSYQKLTEEEVFTLYETVSRAVSVPICVYENPGVTHFDFSDALYARLAELPAIQSIKLAGGYPDRERCIDRIAALRASLPERVSLGISGDAFAVPALLAGCDSWYSVVGGLFPQLAMTLATQALNGQRERALTSNQALDPLWRLFGKYGSLRVVASAAVALNLAQENCLPLPLALPDRQARHEIEQVITQLALA